MRNFLDNRLYIGVRKGVEFYYFGPGCIADYYSSSITYLDEMEVSIIIKCKGNLRLYEVLKRLQSAAYYSEEVYSSRVYKLFKKGVVVFREEPFETKAIFHGVKGAYYPKEIAIELTNTCNYYCPFCYKNASINGGFITDVDIAELDNIIHKNVNNILLTGGEPTLHPNFLKYIEVFTKYANVHIITNGSILYEHDSRTLRKLKVIQFSIYGCDDDEYAKMTGSKNGFANLCKSIEFAKRNGIYAKSAVTLCDETIDHIESFIKTAINFEFDSLRIGIADVFGRGKYLYVNNLDFEKQLNEALNLVIEFKHKYRNDINIELPHIDTQHVGNHDDLYKGVYRGSLQCGCGSEYLVVSHVGEIRPCQMLPESWFSIKDRNALKEHIHGDFHIKQLRESVKKYYNDNAFTTLNISPCQALETFENREKTLDAT